MEFATKVLRQVSQSFRRPQAINLNHDLIREADSSEMALMVAGTRGMLGNAASLRVARIAAAISRTRLRPSSKVGMVHLSLFVRPGAEAANPGTLILSVIRSVC